MGKAMNRRVALRAVGAAVLLAAGPALAQVGGGGPGGGMGGRGRGGRGGGGRGGGRGGRSRSDAPAPTERPANQVEITGVITGIDRAADRVTIAYEPVDALNWPKGTMPFPVSKSDLLKDRKVGDKVRFKLESHEIYELTPASAAAPAAAD